MEFRIEAGGPVLPSRGRYGAGEAEYPGHNDARARRQVHVSSCLAVVVSGCFEFATPAGTALAMPGTILFGNAQEEFTYRYLDRSGARRAVIAFSADLLAETGDRDDGGAFTHAALPPGHGTMALYALARRIAHAQSALEDDVIELTTAARSAARDTRMSRPAPLERRRVMEVARHLERWYARPWTLGDMAGLAGLSRFHFLRVFRAVTGDNPRRYLVAARLRAAIDRLADTCEPITSVALDVGFNDLSHFNATFRAAFGVSPRAWRECVQPRRAPHRQPQ